MDNYLRLNKTWIFDLDGTLVKHNGHESSEGDSILPGVNQFFDKIPTNDTIIILTARKSKYKEITEQFLKENNIRYDHIIFDLGAGERILFNDTKPSGYVTCYAEPLKRDSGLPFYLLTKYKV